MKLIMMMGVPGSGKSTFAHRWQDINTVVVSRDAIRFGLLQEGDEYFAKEGQVFQEFVRQIANGLDKEYEVIADATHINAASRAKLIKAVKNRVPSDELQIEVIWVNVGLNKALEQNELRKGSKFYIPRQVIRRMFEQMEPVDLEHEEIDRVMVVSVDDKEQ